MTTKQAKLLIELIDAKIHSATDPLCPIAAVNAREAQEVFLKSCETPGDFAKDAHEEKKKSPKEIHSNMCAIEENLNKALEHIRDGKESDTVGERISEIKLHILRAKNAFDWIDNFTTIQ